MVRVRVPARWLIWLVARLGAVGCGATLGCAATPSAPPATAAGAPAAPTATAPAVAPAPGLTPLEAARAAFNQSRYAESEAGFRALSTGTDAGAARLGLARLLRLTGRDAEAQPLLTAAIAADPNDTEARVLLAESIWQTGDAERAARSLEAVVELPSAQAARLLLGEILLDLGRRADAERWLMTLIEDYNEDRVGADDGLGLARVGRAAHLLRSPHDANDAFNAAERAAPGEIQILLWRAELFLEKHDPGHAEEVLLEVLEKAPEHPLALVWMAHVKLDQALDFAAARSLCERALATNPRLPHAYFVLAGLELRDLEFTRARERVDTGLGVDAGNLELLAMRGAIGFLADDAELLGQARAQVFAKNASYSRFYSIVGELAEWEHRYDRIVEMMRDAVAVDDEDAEAHAALGLNLIRAGQELAGVQSLRRSAAKDPFNVRVYNTLNLYEHVIPDGYVSRKHGRFVVRYPKAEAALLERYVPPLLERAYRKFTAAYGFTPKEPIGIELYTEREHFAVRTSGLPQTAILGVCFGKTLASLTPKSEPFNLGVTLWHELAHVFHIQMSDSHVPRWLTEGLAEYETLVERPEWRRYQDPDLFVARRMARLPAVSAMNRAFSHAEDMQDMGTAYYASSQIAAMLVERFGRARVNEVLRLHARGKTSNDALAAGLGADGEALGREFSAYLDSRLARYRQQFVPLDVRGEAEQIARAAAAAPRDLGAQLALVLIALEKGDLELARSTWAEAAKLDATAADVRYLGARLAAAGGDAERARSELLALARDGHDGFAVQMSIAELTEASSDRAGLVKAYNRAHELDPTQSAPLSRLLGLAVEAKDGAEELRLLELLAPLEAHDPTIWRRLLELLVERKAFARAVQVGEGAIYADIEGAPTHMRYAQALAGVGRADDAAFEFESALLAPSRPAEVAAAHLAYAEFLAGRGLSARAERQRELAREREREASEAAPP
jgi:tetratricopeptide (TPR) repeat protein